MAELPKRIPGRTGFPATILGYGAMERRGAPTGPRISDGDAEKILNAVLDAGINFIDTSIDYGRSEESYRGEYPRRRREQLAPGEDRLPSMRCSFIAVLRGVNSRSTER